MADTAVVVGVGPGLGLALAQRFASAGMNVAMAARRRDKLDALLPAVRGGAARIYACDATDAASVASLFDAVARDFSDPLVAVYNASSFPRGSILDLEPSAIEAAWRISCLGGFHVGQQAARRMVTKGRGTILFTGATASLRGGAQFAGFAIGKFGLRALAQSMARELGPKGIHVAHVIVDGQIASERYRDRDQGTLLSPAAIAEAYWQLHAQDRTAWTQELDLRPAVEKF